MNIKTKNNILSLVLEPDCTIVNTESDYEKVRDMPGDLKEIKLIIDRVEEIDTAYLQLILSVQASAAQRKIPFTVSGKSDEFEEICKVYGINTAKFSDSAR